MAPLNLDLTQHLIDHDLSVDVFKGNFGLEKENVRVDAMGRLALTPHPKSFGSKMKHPYIKTDFSESQIEMITPVFPTINETYHFLEVLQDLVTEELADEYLWPSSNPPLLPKEENIPIASMNDPIEDHYRLKLAEKYGRKKQLISGIHYNFSFDENFLLKLYTSSGYKEDFRTFKDEVYMKVARNVMKYRWLLIYLTGASPVFSSTYLEGCVIQSDHLDHESRFFPNMNSLRNSRCGYRNGKPLYISYNSLEEYVQGLHDLVKNKELLREKEFYSPVRIKPRQSDHQLQALIQDGVAYLELRMLDLNPLFKNGVGLETLQFIHLFLIYMLLKPDEPFHQEEQQHADLNVETLLAEGIVGRLSGDDGQVSMQKRALEILKGMQVMVQKLNPELDLVHLLELQKAIVLNPDQSYASIIRSAIEKSSYIQYHLDKAKQYAKISLKNGYTLSGYGDLELSTQLLLKAAIKRGIEFQILDRDENFVLLKKGGHREYVKQATKTSLDSYSTVLIMENKLVTKEVLKQQGIRVPAGSSYSTLMEAMREFEIYEDKQIVIKPKSTNFGLGITIFTNHFTKEDFQQALEIAFSHDQTVLIEEFVTGKEYRFLVMGEEVVGILHRVPANVVGDGHHTIEELIQEKNQDPLRGKGYKTPLERIVLGEAERMFLKNHSRSPEDIPAVGEVIYLRENSNISTGGDSIDFTDEIPWSYKEIAIQSAKAAGASFCGVDMMIQDISKDASDQNYSIIELNFNPAIHIHCYPFRGKNRKAADKILDLLFGKID